MELTDMIRALSSLTAVLSVLSLILAGLVLIDCLFLYRRIAIFRKRQQERKEQRNGLE